MWIDALDYTNISCSCDLAVDGLYRGEVRADGFTGASGIGAQFFGTQKGDVLEYNLPEGAYDHLLIRYRSFLPWQGVLTVDGQPSKITLPPTDVFSTISFPWKGGRVLRLTSCGDGGVDIDGFALCPAGSNIAFSPAPQNCRPQIAQNGQNQMCIRDRLKRWHGLPHLATSPSMPSHQASSQPSSYTRHMATTV